MPLNPETLKAMKEALIGVRAQTWHDIAHPEYGGANHRIALQPDAEWTSFGHLATATPLVAAFMAQWHPVNVAALIADYERVAEENTAMEKILNNLGWERRKPTVSDAPFLKG
jgi:hypothetical protein